MMRLFEVVAFALLLQPTWSDVNELLTPPFVAKDPTEVPKRISRTKPRTVEFYLTTEEVVTEIEHDKKAWIWTFNGTVPGPMLWVMEGDTVVIHLTNDDNSVEPHNIDLHAAMGPGGGGAVTEIEAGESTTFTFKAMREGAYIYHCAAEGMPWEHVAYGMFCLILVEPVGGLRRVDKEFYIGQSDWYHTKLAGSDSESEDEEEDSKEGDAEEHSSDDVDFGYEKVYVLDEDRAMEEHPSMYSFNGHKDALTDPDMFGQAIQTDEGDTVRFFFVNGGPNVGSNWHIIGTIWDKVYHGKFDFPAHNEETVYIAPGAAAVFELVTPVPGEKFLIVDHALFRAAKGAAGYMHVEQKSRFPHDLYSPDPKECCTASSSDSRGSSSGDSESRE